MNTEIDLESYLNAFEKKGVSGFEVDSITKMAGNVLEIESFDEYLKFLVNENVKSVFYSEDYFDLEYFYIKEEDYIRKPGYVIKEVRSRMEEINAKTEKDLDELGDRVALLRFFYPFNGLIITCSIYDEEYLTFTSGSEQVELISRNIPEEVIIEEQKKSKQELEQLKNKIFNDHEFQACENLSLRQGYAARLYDKYPESKQVIHDNGLTLNLVSRFIDPLWKEYKDFRKKKL